jgi:kynurenine formamidase
MPGSAEEHSPGKAEQNNEGQKMLDEIELIRMTMEKLILSIKDNLNQEELTQEKLESAMNKLEIIMERMHQNYETGDREKILNEFQYEESKRLFEQMAQLLSELTAIHAHNKKLGSIYYLDESSVLCYKNKNNRS